MIRIYSDTLSEPYYYSGSNIIAKTINIMDKIGKV